MDTSTRDGKARVLVVGESLVDIVIDASGRCTEHVGGSPANVARGLGRLGVGATLLTTYGQDPRGDTIENDLRRSGVHVIQAGHPQIPTSTATAHLQHNNSATYTFDLNWELASVELPSFDHLHIGSLAIIQDPGASQVARIVAGAAHTTTVSYDVNVRPEMMNPRAESITRIDSMIGHSAIVKLSEEDLAWLRPGERYLDSVRWLMARGPSILAVTHGEAGATAYTRSGATMVRSRPVEVVDTIGAGDAFMAGLLHALTERNLLGGDARESLREIDPNTLRDVMHHANYCAALTVATAGAQLPNLDDLAAAS
ncbi:carbohydrate kinase [Rhodococcus jostii]|uniref:Carbohydrate kinase n=1 Tax=Rhodococcus jostii TaxID=132919 RepID=A0ABU4CN15_RHOJO|nr:carbohydrate kinase [Rhodococcus jostii]MDV6284961.1 carbohydrate kinase [Rhodococcus jostii]